MHPPDVYGKIHIMSTTETNTHPTLAQLQERASMGDQFALRALRCYRTDAELEAACRESDAADYTDGGHR